MSLKGVDHWVSSPYCFCKDLPWLVLSGLPASPALLGGGWGWEDWAILAATLIALAFFLLLLFLLCCLLWPGALCCRKGCSSCCKTGAGAAGAGAGTKKEKKGFGSGQIMEMSSIGGSDESNLADLKLPRAWMDTSKGDLTEDRGDLGLGGGGFYGNQKTWTSANGGDRIDGSGGLNNRSTNLGVHLRRSATAVNSRHQGYDADSFDGGTHGGTEEDSARGDYYRNQSTVTVITPNIGEHIREAVNEWQKKSGLVSQRLEENRQTLHDSLEERSRGGGAGGGGGVLSESATSSSKTSTSFESGRRGGGGGGGHANTGLGYSTMQESSQHESRYEEQQKSSSMALVKSSASTANANTSSAVATSSGTGVGPILQCYTVTKKTTTTTYGDEEGDEETAVVTTTEKKWQEGMNEVGEISVAASASAGELLPSIGAPAHVLNDVNNVRCVKSLTTVEGGVSDVVRRYEYQQTSRDTETLF